MNIHKNTQKITIYKKKTEKRRRKTYFFLQMMMKTKLAKEQSFLKDETSVNIAF